MFGKCHFEGYEQEPNLNRITINYIANTGNVADRSEAFNGYIDDVRFYNRALSENEVTTVFNVSGGQ